MKTNKQNTTSKNKVEAPKKSKKNYRNGIMGIMQLFAVASIAYSTIVIAIGTEGVVPLILVTPQAILAVVIALHKFTK